MDNLPIGVPIRADISRCETATAKERGAVLFMSLVILLIVTLLGLSSIQTTSMQEQMVRNAYNNDLAFQAAETAISEAELAISKYTSLTAFKDDSAGANGLYEEQVYPQPPHWHGIEWDQENGKYITATTPIEDVVEQPKYIVESVRDVLPAALDRLNLSNIGQDTVSDCTHIFRVTAYATGATNNAQNKERVMLQSTYGLNPPGNKCL